MWPHTLSSPSTPSPHHPLHTLIHTSYPFTSIPLLTHIHLSLFIPTLTLLTCLGTRLVITMISYYYTWAYSRFSFHHAELYTEEAALQSQNVLECLRILIERGAPVDCRDGGGMQPLHWALQFPCECVHVHEREGWLKRGEGRYYCYMVSHGNSDFHPQTI